MPIVLGNPAHNDLSLVQNPVARNYALNIKYVTLDHKTNHRSTFFEIEMYTSASWINKFSMDVLYGSKYWENRL